MEELSLVVVNMWTVNSGCRVSEGGKVIGEKADDEEGGEEGNTWDFSKLTEETREIVAGKTKDEEGGGWWWELR